MSERIPLVVGQIRQDPDKRYAEFYGEVREVQIEKIGLEHEPFGRKKGKRALVCSLNNGKRVSILEERLINWPVVEKP